MSVLDWNPVQDEVRVSAGSGRVPSRRRPRVPTHPLPSDALPPPRPSCTGPRWNVVETVVSPSNVLDPWISEATVSEGFISPVLRTPDGGWDPVDGHPNPRISVSV